MDSSSTLIAFLLGMSIGACIMLLAVATLGRNLFKTTEWPKWVTIGRSCGTVPAISFELMDIANNQGLKKYVVVSFISETELKLQKQPTVFFVIACDDFGEKTLREIIQANIPE